MAYTAKEEANLRAATEAYNKVISPLDPTLADQYFAPNYIQHGQLATDGVAGLKKFLVKAHEMFPGIRHRIAHVFADGDYVVFHVHVHLKDGMAEQVAVDIFRMEDEKIAEHWECIQDIPANLPHNNGMV